MMRIYEVKHNKRILSVKPKQLLALKNIRSISYNDKRFPSLYFRENRSVSNFFQHT